MPLVRWPLCLPPAVHASEDTFVGKHHSEQLAAAYAGDKNIVLVEGDHNSGG